MDLYANHCRLCRTDSGGDPQENWTQLTQPDGNEYLLEKIQACTGVWIRSDDALPKRICPSCEASLDQANTFRLQCQEADAWWNGKVGQIESVYVKPEVDVEEEEESVQVKEEPGAEEFAEESDYEPTKEEPSSDEYEPNPVRKKAKPKKKQASQKDTQEKPKAKRSKDKNVECTLCFSKFFSEGFLKLHMEKKHGSNQQLFACDQCDRKYEYIGQLKKHQIYHSDERPFSCKECPKKFKCQNDLNGHLRWAHQPPEVREKIREASKRTCVCPYCGKVSLSTNAYKKHLRTHTGEKLYECNVCNKSFTWHWSFQNHMLIHTGEKPHVCEHCQKAFRLRTHMMTHIRGVHTNERPFQCRFCPKAFVTRQSMQFHEKTHGAGVDGTTV